MQELLAKFILGQLSKFLTPEVVAHYEKELKKFVVEKLREVAKATPEKIDDAVVEVVAKALEVA